MQGDEKIEKPTERQAMPGKTPGSAEGPDDERRTPPMVERPAGAGPAPGVSNDEAPAVRGPEPSRKE